MENETEKKEEKRTAKKKKKKKKEGKKKKKEKKDQKKGGGTKTTERKQVFVVLNWKREGLQKMKVFGGPSEILVLYLSSMCDARHSSVTVD